MPLNNAGNVRNAPVQMVNRGADSEADITGVNMLMYQMQLSEWNARQQELTTQIQQDQAAAAQTRLRQQQRRSAAQIESVAQAVQPTTAPSLSATMAAAPQAAEQVTSPSNKKVPVLAKDFYERYKQRAGFFSLMHSGWVRDVCLTRPRPAIDTRGPERWSSEQSRLDAITAEILDLLPEDLRPRMAVDPVIAKLFKKAITDHRTRYMYNVNVALEDIFDGIYPVEVRDAIKGKRYDEECLVWLRRGDREDYKSQYPPIFYPPGDKTEGVAAFLFLNPLLIRIAKVILFGRKCLTNGGAPPTNTMGRILDIRHTTPGLIALVCQIARFLVSPDKEFTSVGDRTEIKYWENSEYLVELMMKKANKRGKQSENMHLLFAAWDKELFSHVLQRGPSAAESQSTRDATNKDRELEMEWLGSEESESESESESEEEDHPAVRRQRKEVNRGGYVEVDEEDVPKDGSESEVESDYSDTPVSVLAPIPAPVQRSPPPSARLSAPPVSAAATTTSIRDTHSSYEHPTTVAAPISGTLASPASDGFTITDPATVTAFHAYLASLHQNGGPASFTAPSEAPAAANESFVVPVASARNTSAVHTGSATSPAVPTPASAALKSLTIAARKSAREASPSGPGPSAAARAARSNDTPIETSVQNAPRSMSSVTKKTPTVRTPDNAATAVDEAPKRRVTRSKAKNARP